MRGGRRRDLLLILVLVLAPVVAHAPAWRAGRLLAPGEGEALHLPLRIEAWRALSRGEIPSWNPSSFSGTPLLAAYRPGALHPLMLVLAPLRPELAFQLLVLVSLGLAGPLTFACARRLGAETVGAFLAGLGFALGPYLVSHLGDSATVVAAPTLPFLMLATEAHLARPRAATATLGALAVALLFLAGSKEAVGAGAALLGIRLLLGGAASGGRISESTPPGGAKSFLAATLAGALLAAPQLLPTLLALGEAGPGRTGAAAAPGPPLAGVAGLVVRYVSHTPAPLLGLAAVPLLAVHPPMRTATAALLLCGVPLALGRRPDEAGTVALTFDFSLALLGGLSMSAQWAERRTPRGRRLRLLTAGTAVCAAGGLSVATTVTGPLAGELAAPVGLLALSLILYSLLADSDGPVTAHLFLVPLVASFLLQPWGRDAWAGAPSRQSLEAGTPTRAAIDRVMGPRRGETTLTITESWPEAHAEDLAWANLATFTDRRNANGYDPLVPAVRRAALEGMRADGTLTRAFLETDPGRLELLGVRWVQVPTEALAVAADPDGLGDSLDVVVEPPRPRLLALPFTPATEIRIASFLQDGHALRGELVAECVARLATGREIRLPIRAGMETPTREGFPGQGYLGVLPLPGRYTVVALRVRAMPGAPPLRLLRAGLRDAETGRTRGVSTTSAYLSDEVRLVEVAETPFVTLFQVRRGIGRARVVESLRRVPDAALVAELLRSPTRLGVDSAREAIADAHDVVGVTLPPDSRSSAAVVARARGGRLVVQARGPGLLVVGEGWHPGWTARVDGVPARVLRVNGDRIGVPLGGGIHRIVLRHRARGLDLGLLLAGLAAAGLITAGVAEARRSSRV